MLEGKWIGTSWETRHLQRLSKVGRIEVEIETLQETGAEISRLRELKRDLVILHQLEANDLPSKA